MVKDYLNQGKSIDKNFIDQYIALYDSNFSGWINELDNLFTYIFLLSDNHADFRYFRQNYPYPSNYQSQIPVNQSGLELMKETPLTKVIIISSDNKKKLGMVKAIFPELKNWKYQAQQEFIYTADLQDKTRLIIVNKNASTLDTLFEKNFKDRKIE